jgi:hypothetical protein
MGYILRWEMVCRGTCRRGRAGVAGESRGVWLSCLASPLLGPTPGPPPERLAAALYHRPHRSPGQATAGSQEATARQQQQAPQAERSQQPPGSQHCPCWLKVKQNSAAGDLLDPSR